MQNIYDRKQNSVPTIDDALHLVGKRAETFEGWKLKGLGLRLVLLGLAEMQALRLSKLAGMVYKIEESLLEKKDLYDLQPKELFQLYQMSTRALTESSEFVERTLKSVSWSDLETEILQKSASEQPGTPESGIDAKSAEELLVLLARMKAEHDGQKQQSVTDYRST